MEPMEDENCDSDFVEVYNVPRSNEDLKFDQIIMTLQEIVIDTEFEKTLTSFMRNHWNIFDQHANKDSELKLFQLYKAELQKYLQKRITAAVPDFEWNAFYQLFQSRKDRVDEQLLDTILSLEDVENFKLFIKDYRTSYEEEEMFKVLTIKSNKIPESKKVKGKDNIFAGGDVPGMFDKGFKAPLPKKVPTQEKTEEQLMIPDLILTVKPLRKE